MRVRRVCHHADEEAEPDVVHGVEDEVGVDDKHKGDNRVADIIEE